MKKKVSRLIGKTSKTAGREIRPLTEEVGRSLSTHASPTRDFVSFKMLFELHNRLQGDKGKTHFNV